MIKTVSFHWFSQKLYENVLQNVLTDKSRNFSQTSPRRHISNYSSIQSMSAVEILQVGTSQEIAPHKENRPQPTWRKWLLKGKTRPPPQKGEKRHVLQMVKKKHSFVVSRGGERAYSCPPPEGTNERM